MRCRDVTSLSLSLSFSAPMPCNVVRVLVAEEEVITEGQALVILEAMKMEHVIKVRTRVEGGVNR
jgi:biotin carboxyl carrier protein